MGPKIRSRMIGRHRKDCLAVQQADTKAWRSPWGCLDWSPLDGGEPRFWGDAIGRRRAPGRGANTSWLRYLCNDHACRAILLVNEMDAADAAELARR